MESRASVRRPGWLFLFRQHARRARRRHQERISSKADEGRDPASDRRALQLFRGAR